jgi:hypothetical protein
MNYKEVYSYHPETFEFLGFESANESPLEPGVYLIPAHATEIPMTLKLKKNKCLQKKIKRYIVFLYCLKKFKSFGLKLLPLCASLSSIN